MSGTISTGPVTIDGDVPVTGPVAHTGDATIDAGGTLDLLSGTFSNDGTLDVLAGGTLTVGDGVTASDIGPVTNNGLIDLSSPGGAVTLDGAIVNAGTIVLGDTVTTAANLTNQGTLVGAGGTIGGAPGIDVINNGQILSGAALTIDAAVTGSGVLDIASGATLTLGSTVAASDAINFTGAGGGDLVLGDGDEIKAAIGGFDNSAEIDLTSLAYQQNAGYDYSFVTGDLTAFGVNNSQQTVVVPGLSIAEAENLTVTSDGHGGTLIQSLCFLAGTAIATPDGDRAIETLGAGDLVLTADGAARPVRWLGRQTIATRFADPLRVAPIRILAGALDANQPARDLFVSPDHALMVDGVFAQAGALVNGLSITRETTLPAVFVYYHVELADHSLVLAEGVPAETFIDNVDRLAFDNWAEHELPAEAAPLVEMAHPRAKSHRQLPRELRDRLMARARALHIGHAAAAA